MSDMQSAPLEAAGDSRQYLTFLLAGEEYGVDILRVQGIQGLQKCTALPNAPAYMLGVMNLRGAIIPVMDLRVRFDLPAMERTKTTVVVVVRVEREDEERTVGVVVDAVSEVYTVDVDQCQDSPRLGSAIDMAFIRGLATVDEKMIVLLDVDQLVVEGMLEIGELQESVEASA